MLSEVKSRALNFSELLTHTVNIYLQHFVNVVGIPLLILLPLIAVQSFVTADALRQVYESPAAFLLNYGSIGQFSFLSFTVWLIFAIATVFTGAYVTAYVLRLIEGQTPKPMDVINFVISKFPSLIVTAIVLAACLLGLALLLILPAIYFGVYWFFTLQIVLTENKTALDAMSASKELVNNRWLQAFGYIVAVGIVCAIISWVFSSIVGGIFGTGISINYLTGDFGFNFGTFFIATFLSSVVSTALSSVSLVFGTLLFVNWKHFRAQTVSVPAAPAA